MDKRARILEKLKQIAKGGTNSMLAQVKAVNADECTCTLWDEDTKLEYSEVRLRPVLDGKESFTLIPKINTWALAVRIENDEDWMLIAVGEADKWKLKCDQVEFNGGLNGGLIKIDSLISEINGIKTDINNLKTALSTWVAIPNDGGAALKIATAGWYGSQLQPVNKSAIENTKIKH